jgi:Dolichyl-phosphate-mannose-protein mannosyltransferase
MSLNPTLNWRSAWCIAFVLKLAIFLFFIGQRDPNWNPSLIVDPVALKQLDTEWYFQPLDEMVEGRSYNSVCKLPGFAPIYLPLRAVMSKEAAYNGICVLQLLLDALCTGLLALLTFRLFKQNRISWIVLVLYGISTFVSVRSNYVLSDSFCTSFLIVSLFFLAKFIDSKKIWHVMLTGFFLFWAFEMRPVILVVYPVFLSLVVYHLGWRWHGIKISLIFIAPIALGTLWWSYHNRQLHDRSIWLIAPVEECMTHYGPEAAAFRRFVIAIGHDFQPWSKGSAAEWFLKRGQGVSAAHPFVPSDFTPDYNLDTLRQLNADYKKIENGEVNSVEFNTTLIERMHRCTDSYIEHNGLDYYLFNRLNFIGMFVFPSRIDDLPLPPRDQMNTMQLLMKIGSLVLLWFVHAMAIVGIGVACWRFGFRALLWAGVGGSSIVVLGFLGFIEQRYLTTSYPISIVFAALGCSAVVDWIWNKSKSIQTSQ